MARVLCRFLASIPLILVSMRELAWRRRHAPFPDFLCVREWSPCWKHHLVYATVLVIGLALLAGSIAPLVQEARRRKTIHPLSPSGF